jgi:UDP-N-acetylglucosamine 4,6-dehydratase
MFRNKKLLIVGGTGSFGEAMLNRVIKSKIKFNEIRIFSRDEKKQDDLRKKLNNKNIKFYIGDVRNKDSIEEATRGVDFIFHAAALKQVPSCEFYPLEAVRTNILGTSNLLDAAELNKVKKVVCLSTDKAVYPINAMGISKSMMEKVIIAKSRTLKNTSLCITRYGNVMGSRGSVIPMLINQILENKPLTITEKKMTRFMMSMDEALDLVIYALKNGKNGQTFIKKSPASNLTTLVNAIKIIFNKKKYPLKIIGIRHGEKMHETLMNKEEKSLSIENRDYFIINPDNRDLNYDKYFSFGKLTKKNVKDYTSEVTKQLSTKELIKKLKRNINI